MIYICHYGGKLVKNVNDNRKETDRLTKSMVVMLCLLLLCPFQLFADVKNLKEINKQGNVPNPSEKVDKDTLPKNEPKENSEDPVIRKILKDRQEVIVDSISVKKDSIYSSKAEEERADREFMIPDSIAVDTTSVNNIDVAFNPNPNRAVWLSALFPGLGQVYNRRYWKLPIIAGGFLGITYAVTWNGRMLSDYTKAYRDAMDNDPSTKSYLAFLPATMNESNVDMTWLQNALKTQKDFYRRNRDLSIICMVGLYLLCMVDAYVDASLSHFDISPNVSMNVFPAMIDSNQNGLPSVGVQWALNF